MSQVDPADEALLVRLGGIAATVDPPPPLLAELGRASYEMRRMDVELAQLVDDSALELAGVRATTSDARLLTFEGAEVAIELQISLVAGQLSLIGQVVPVPDDEGGIVYLQTPDGRVTSAVLDDVGGFRLDAVPARLLRLHIQLPHGTTVTTTWIRP
jgi:hypothetical protein